MSLGERSGRLQVLRPVVTSNAVPALVILLTWFFYVERVRRSDFLVFLHAASQVTDGLNPYVSSTDPYLWGGSAYVYPYLTSYLFVPLTVLSVPAADVVYFLVSAVAILAGCRLLGVRDPVIITVLLLSEPAIRSFQVGSINALLFVAGAVVWRFRDRIVPVAVGFTFLAGSKLFLLPMTVWLVVTRARKTAVVALAGLVAFLGVGFLLQPISVGDYFSSIAALAEHEGPVSQSAFELLHKVLPVTAARIIPLVVAGGLVLAGVLYRRRRPAHGDPVLYCASLLAALIATPVYWSHYTLLAGLIVLITSPSRKAIVLFAIITWVLARPA
jgi:hypothetical protein